MLHSVRDYKKYDVNISTQVKHSKTLCELKEKIHVLTSPQKLSALWVNYYNMWNKWNQKSAAKSTILKKSY